MAKNNATPKEGRDKKGLFVKGNKLSVGNEGGRPTKYKPEYCQQIIDYFTLEPQQTFYKKEYFQNGALKSEYPITLPAQLPTFQGFAHEIDISMQAMNEWRDNIPEFNESYMRAKELQEKIWLVNGMGGLYNSQFAQFFGKNCLGYKDKSEVESRNENLNTELTDLTAEQRAERIKELLNK